MNKFSSTCIRHFKFYFHSIVMCLDQRYTLFLNLIIIWFYGEKFTIYDEIEHSLPITTLNFCKKKFVGHMIKEADLRFHCACFSAV